MNVKHESAHQKGNMEGGYQILLESIIIFSKEAVTSCVAHSPRAREGDKNMLLQTYLLSGFPFTQFFFSWLLYLPLGLLFILLVKYFHCFTYLFHSI